MNRQHEMQQANNSPLPPATVASGPVSVDKGPSRKGDQLAGVHFAPGMVEHVTDKEPHPSGAPGQPHGSEPKQHKPPRPESSSRNRTISVTFAAEVKDRQPGPQDAASAQAAQVRQSINDEHPMISGAASQSARPPGDTMQISGRRRSQPGADTSVDEANEKHAKNSSGRSSAARYIGPVLAEYDPIFVAYLKRKGRRGAAHKGTEWVP